MRSIETVFSDVMSVGTGDAGIDRGVDGGVDKRGTESTRRMLATTGDDGVDVSATSETGVDGVDGNVCTAAIAAGGSAYKYWIRG